MKNNKWIKWLVGLSGAALFAGFIGLIASENPEATASGAANGETASGGGANPTVNPWNDDSGSQGFTGRERHGGYDDGSASGESSGQSEFGERLRTRAS